MNKRVLSPELALLFTHRNLPIAELLEFVQVTHSLQMRELVDGVANGTLTDARREELQNELNASARIIQSTRRSIS